MFAVYKLIIDINYVELKEMQKEGRGNSFQLAIYSISGFLNFQINEAICVEHNAH